MSLSTFLTQAKARTYASQGEGNERQLEDGAKELSFRDGDYLYRDRYYGFNPFAGEEVVWRCGQAVWTMHYHGGVTDAVIPPIDVYRFLQSALRNVEADRPFRGPHEYSDGDFTYRDQSRGSLDRFAGRETISYQGREVYTLDYHGGSVGHADGS